MQHLKMIVSLKNPYFTFKYHTLLISKCITFTVYIWHGNFGNVKNNIQLKDFSVNILMPDNELASQNVLEQITVAGNASSL